MTTTHNTAHSTASLPEYVEASTPAISPLPFEFVEATEHHGPYITTAYGTTIYDFYVMSDPSMPSVRNGGTSKPVPFVDAVGNAEFMCRAANSHDKLVSDNADLVAALEWFADPKNWHEEQLSEGYHFSAEWKVGFDPREIARVALSKLERPAS
jgi:hypothetical protein